MLKQIYIPKPKNPIRDFTNKLIKDIKNGK